MTDGTWQQNAVTGYNRGNNGTGFTNKPVTGAKATDKSCGVSYNSGNTYLFWFKYMDKK